jgi:hypothetical protein
MGRLRRLRRWLWRAWPILVVAIAVVHYVLHRLFPHGVAVLNKFVGAGLQVFGGILVLIPINRNIGTFKRGSLPSLVAQWFREFPLVKRSVTLQ